MNRNLSATTLRASALLATLFCLAVLSAAPDARGDLYHLTIDNSLSSLSLSGNYLNSPITFEEQLPGSLSAFVTGSLDINYIPGASFNLFGGSIVPDVNPGSFLPFNTPASYAGTFAEVAPGVDVHMAFRDWDIDVFGGVINLDGSGNFDAGGVSIASAGGTAESEITGFGIDVVPLTDFAGGLNNSAIGNLSEVGPSLILNLPISTSISYTSPSTLLTQEFALTGSLVATAELLPPPPPVLEGCNIGYYTDDTVASLGPEYPILRGAGTPVPITDISTADLSDLDILMIDESSNDSLSGDLVARLPDIQAWVEAGGKLVVHDRFVSNDVDDPQSSQFLLGQPGILVDRDFSNDADLNIVPPGSNDVVDGPFGLIDDFDLDGGNSSSHGFVVAGSLPAEAQRFLQVDGQPDQIAALSYRLGNGYVYYSTIPLDFYLDNSGPPELAAFIQNVYTPNVLAYMKAVPEPSGLVLAGIGAAAFLVTTRRRRR